MKTGAAPKLSLKLFAIACEAIEAEFTAAFTAVQKAAKVGNLAEIERLETLCDVLATRLEGLIEGQLAAHGQARPAAPKLVA